MSREFAPSFTKVIGTDPSEVMVTQARSSTKEPNVEFRQGMAEDMGFIEDGSLDMLVAGQAAHCRRHVDSVGFTDFIRVRLFEIMASLK